MRKFHYRLSTPVDPVVSVAELADYLRITQVTDDLSVRLDRLIRGASRWLEDYLGRAFLRSTWRLVLDSFPVDDVLEMPRGPLVTVESIKWFNLAGVATTWDPSNYVVMAGEEARVVLVEGGTWPVDSNLRGRHAAEVDFTAGYSTNADEVQATPHLELFPADLRSAVLRTAAWWHENPEEMDQVIPDGSMGIVSMQRRYF